MFGIGCDNVANRAKLGDGLTHWLIEPNWGVDPKCSVG